MSEPKKLVRKMITIEKESLSKFLVEDVKSVLNDPSFSLQGLREESNAI